ncbi:MAG: SDR family oxidoreductase, partial [Candidatus Limnocylindria bacterium]
MKIAITGANGFVGRNVVSALQEDGSTHSVRGLVRDLGAAKRLPGGLDLREIDVTRPETLRGAFDGIDAVVHT